MLILFDIDGTICDTQEVEGRCFAAAFEEACGRSLESIDWTRYEEPTSSGITQELLKADPDSTTRARLFQERFVQRLREARPEFPGDFSPLPGAVPFIERLHEDPAFTVAFATGGFDSEAAFKLDCCGIDLSRFPHATSSDTPRRRDILPLAALRAGATLERAVYFGDAPWDVEASRALGIPMIGIGRRVQELGTRNSFRDFSQPDPILKVLERIAGDLPGHRMPRVSDSS
ncbi:haloacid dehalogenase-like hydrolase [Planctomycetes bacterium Poly30]|uniref:Haloacid dehalogenase-like hydrolase n=1 Tax=Saltatorellus ferox TaxID=2528018 RepID=A0A518ELV3_9BACT|nr:haloacid dehalogenase-like hydrolase [Planctomycetes bacterium Poly30]